jgi:dTDP-4-amino-4,6-dideoxygalactose transaminase
MKIRVNLFEPTVSEESINNIKDVIDSKWLGKGSMSSKFEVELASVLGTKNIALVSCASDAIFGAFNVFDIPKGSKFALPVNSFPAVLSAIIQAGLVPVFIDIDPETGNIDLFDLYQNKNIAGVFVTHYGGNPVDVVKIREKYGENFLIFEDSACALGTTTSDGMVGCDADFSCWSFDAMKLVTAGEGGAFSIRNNAIFNKAKMYFYLGLPIKDKSGLDSALSGSENWWDYDISMPGIRSVFTNINGAIGLPNLLTINEKLSRLSKIRELYEESFKNKLDYIKIDSSVVQYANYFFTIFSSDRDRVARDLLAKGVYCSLRYSRVDDFSLSSDYLNGVTLNGADKFYSCALNIPIHAGMSMEDAQFVADSVLDVI